MFTGIITDVGEIFAVTERDTGVRLRVATSYDPDTIAMGASIAHAGICLTAIEMGRLNDGRGYFDVEASEETLRCTTLGAWRAGTKVNLERALGIGAELGGHIVTGHVDGIGEVISAESEGDSLVVAIRAPGDLAPYIAAKGSIALDGVSLTVNSVADSGDGAEFTINLIPHTAEVTTFDAIAPGRPVNIEIDVLARYLGRMAKFATS